MIQSENISSQDCDESNIEQAYSLDALRDACQKNDMTAISSIVQVHLEIIAELQKHIAELQKQIKKINDENAELKTEIKKLKASLNKNSSNSSKPPSSDAFKKRVFSLRTKSAKKSGGQPGHKPTNLRQTENPDIILTHHAPKQCPHCQTSLNQAQTSRTIKRQVIGFEFKKICTEHQGRVLKCQGCKKEVIPVFLKNVTHPVQYAPNVLSLAVYLHYFHFVPLARTRELFRDVFRLDLAEGTVIRSCKLVASAVEPSLEAIKELLINENGIGADETGCRTDSARPWVHVACTAMLTHLCVHPGRGFEAMKDIGILENFKGVLMHDRLAAYFKFCCKHALCNAHLLRELLGLHECYDQDWAAKLKALLIEIKRAVDRSGPHRDSLSPSLLASYSKRWDSIVSEGLQTNPRSAKVPGKRGRAKQTPMRNLLDALVKYKSNFLMFMYDFAVPFDNNQAERDLRMLKALLKVAGCFRTVDGAECFAKIRSYLSTARKHGLGMLEVLTAAINGNPFIPVPQTS